MTAEICSFAAIPEGAKNKRNAFRLLEILLSEELQAGTDSAGGNMTAVIILIVAALVIATVVMVVLLVKKGKRQ